MINKRGSGISGVAIITILLFAVLVSYLMYSIFSSQPHPPGAPERGHIDYQCFDNYKSPDSCQGTFKVGNYFGECIWDEDQNRCMGKNFGKE